VGATPEAAWLAGNAHRFGFALSYPDGFEEITGYGYEPWHFRYIGREAAQEMYDSEQILESYLQGCAQEEEGLRCPEEPIPILSPNANFIGGPCEEESTCTSIGAAALCLQEEYPGGMCSFPCTRYCPDREGNTPSFCVASSEGAEEGLCHSRCDYDSFLETGCREGFYCGIGQRPNQGKSSAVCLPGDASEQP